MRVSTGIDITATTIRIGEQTFDRRPYGGGYLIDGWRVKGGRVVRAGRIAMGPTIVGGTVRDCRIEETRRAGPRDLLLRLIRRDCDLSPHLAHLR